MDAMLVLRQGTVVFERYKTMRPFDKHNWFSCTKSTVAVSLALLEHEGKVDVMKPVSHYLPELAGSVWDTVTLRKPSTWPPGSIRQSTKKRMHRTNPETRLVQMGHEYRCACARAGASNQSPVDVLRAMKRTKPGHTVFEYNSINTYVLQKIVETITKMPLAEFFGDRVWRRIGAQNDGYLGLDKQGHAMGFGFMNSTLRDLGRYGMIYTPSSSILSRTRSFPRPSSGSSRPACGPRCTQRARWEPPSRRNSTRFRAG